MRIQDSFPEKDIRPVFRWMILNCPLQDAVDLISMCSEKTCSLIPSPSYQEQKYVGGFSMIDRIPCTIMVGPLTPDS